MSEDNEKGVNDQFIYKIQLELIIFSNHIDPESISRDLEILPDIIVKKGDFRYSKHSGSKIVETSNIWRYHTIKLNATEESISHSSRSLMTQFHPKVELLKKYKNDPESNVVIWIWVTTDNAGIGIDLNEDELSFFTSIANRLHFSFICNDDSVNKSESIDKT